MPGTQVMFPFTTENRAALSRVQSEVNRNVRYQSDAITHPRLEIPERWDLLLEGGLGDCEDYALTKRHLLRNQFPRWHQNFRIATCWQRRGDNSTYHATLIVETDQGAWVLDNNYSSPVRIETLGWHWDRIEDPQSPTGWSKFRLRG
jgi:predicted transglutaminase-like cysteine proteinase